MIEFFARHKLFGWPDRPVRAVGSRSDKWLHHPPPIAREPTWWRVFRKAWFWDICPRMARPLVAARPGRCFARCRPTRKQRRPQGARLPPL